MFMFMSSNSYQVFTVVKNYPQEVGVEHDYYDHYRTAFIISSYMPIIFFWLFTLTYDWYYQWSHVCILTSNKTSWHNDSNLHNAHFQTNYVSLKRQIFGWIVQVLSLTSVHWSRQRAVCLTSDSVYTWYTVAACSTLTYIFLIHYQHYHL